MALGACWGRRGSLKGRAEKDKGKKHEHAPGYRTRGDLPIAVSVITLAVEPILTCNADVGRLPYGPLIYEGCLSPQSLLWLSPCGSATTRVLTTHFMQAGPK